MAGHLQHVVTGQPFKPPASDWNAFVDAAQAIRNARVIFGVNPLDGNPVSIMAQGTLTSIMLPSPDGRVQPMSFTFKRWLDGEIGGEKDEEETDTTGYNRSTVLEGAIGDYVICILSDNGELNPVHVDPSCSE